MSLLLVIAAIQASQVEPLRLPPTDECRYDRSFVDYRARLSESIDRKDVATLRQLVASDIKISFGADGGWLAFVREWELDKPRQSSLWHELSEVLALGCQAYDGSRVAPSYFGRTGDYDLPPYVATQKGAALRTRPEDAAPVVLVLDSHVLIETLESAPEGWLAVRLTDGRSGYVRSAAVRSEIDYRARFEKWNGRWVMAAFIAGD